MEARDYIPNTVLDKLTDGQVNELWAAMKKYRHLRFADLIGKHPNVVEAFSIAEHTFLMDVNEIMSSRKQVCTYARYCVAYYLVEVRKFSYTKAAKAIGLKCHATISCFYTNHVYNQHSEFWNYWERYKQEAGL